MFEVLEIFLQYSLAGASVRECPLAMQEELITSYLGERVSSDHAGGAHHILPR